MSSCFPFRSSVKCCHTTLRTIYLRWILLKKAARSPGLEIFELQRLRKRLMKTSPRRRVDQKKTAMRRGQSGCRGRGQSAYRREDPPLRSPAPARPRWCWISSNALHGDSGMIADGDVVSRERKRRDGRNAPDFTGDHAVPSQDHHHVRRSKINSGPKTRMFVSM